MVKELVCESLYFHTVRLSSKYLKQLIEKNGSVSVHKLIAIRRVYEIHLV